MRAETAILPPHNLNAEEAILGGLLQDNETFDRLGDLEPAHFYHHGNRMVFEGARSLIMRARPADVVTVHDYLLTMGTAETIGGLPYLNSLVESTPSLANVSRYAEIVRETALLRKLAGAADTVQQMVLARQQPAAELLDAAQAEFGKLALGAVRNEPVSISDTMVRSWTTWTGACRARWRLRASRRAFRNWTTS